MKKTFWKIPQGLLVYGYQSPLSMPQSQPRIMKNWKISSWITSESQLWTSLWIILKNHTKMPKMHNAWACPKKWLSAFFKFKVLFSNATLTVAIFFSLRSVLISNCRSLGYQYSHRCEQNSMHVWTLTLFFGFSLSNTHNPWFHFWFP